MADMFGSPLASGKEAPAENGFAITPNDSTDLATVTRGLYVGITGDIKVTLAGGTTVEFGALAAGVVHPLRVKRVWATSTTVTQIVGLY